MDYTFVINVLYSNFTSIFNILNAIMTKYRFLLNKKHLILEIEPRDFLQIFLRFLPFEPHFLIKVFLIKKRLCRLIDKKFLSEAYLSIGHVFT